MIDTFPSTHMVPADMKNKSTSRLKSYSSLAVIAAAAAPGAQAAVTVTDVNLIFDFATDVSLTASFNTNFLIEFASSGGPGSPADRYFWGANGNLDFINRSSGNDPVKVAGGVTIGPTSLAGGSVWYGAVSYQTSSNDLQANDGEFNPGDQGYLAIRFEDGGDYYYGWVDLTMANDGIMTVNRWALEDVANVAVVTPIPEPTVPALSLLALGATGLRRRRAVKR
jgi:hypothetical protein